MNKIQNALQLKQEIKRLESLSNQQEIILLQDFDNIKNQFNLDKIFKFALSFLSQNNQKQEGPIGSSFWFVTNFLLKKILFKSYSGITGSIFTSLLELLFSKIIQPKSKSWLDSVKSWYKKRF